MPKDDIQFACKKRHHPDGLHLSTSTPKRLLSISKAELGSSIESAHDPTTLPGSTFGSHGSFWNSDSSAVITSDCSTSMCVGHSIMSHVVSSKPSTFGFTHSQTPSDAASYNLESSKTVRGSLIDGKCKGIWTYRSTASECEETTSDEDFSEVTDARTNVSTREPESVYLFGKATHIISRREKCSLNPKRAMDDAWLNDGYEDYLSREKQLESNSSLHNKSRRRQYTFSSMACESGSSWATGTSVTEEMRSKQGLPHNYGTVRKESMPAAAEVLVGLQAQESIEGLEQLRNQGHFSYEVDMLSQNSHNGRTKEQSPAYVLSSGRLSLEEEARLGRRAPTIDHDFEEYFSSLML